MTEETRTDTEAELVSDDKEVVNDDSVVETPVEQPVETPIIEQDKKPRSQRRIEQLLEKNKQIEQEKKELEERIKEYDALERPNADKYDDDDEYEIDKTAYIQQKATEKQERKRLETLANKANKENQVAYKEASQEFYQKIDGASSETKAFIRENAGKHKPRPQGIELEIMDSPHSVEIFEVILKNHEKLNGLTDIQFIKEVAKIEAKFENAKKSIKPPLSIPNPPTIFESSSSGSSGNSNKANVPDWAKYSYTQLRNMK